LSTALNLPERQDWTVDDLASLPKDLRYELIDGRLILPSPTPFHQYLNRQVANALELNCPDGFLISSDQSVAIDRDNEPRPDIVVIRDEGASRTPVWVEYILLAGEVISPSSTIQDRRDKAKKYASFGIPHYWTIDPLAARVTLTEYLLGDDNVFHVRLITDEAVTLKLPWEVRLDLPGWTARRDRLRKAAGA
jgi:Uma2 family endonuclease